MCCRRWIPALAGLMVQVNSSDPGALSKHLNSVAERTERPIVVQDYPVITGIRITTADLIAAVRAVMSAVAVKSESSPSPPAVAELAAGLDVPGLRWPRRHLPARRARGRRGRRDDRLLRAGGPDRVCGGVPRWRLRRCSRGVAGLLPLVNFEFQAGIALGLRKHSLVRRGLIAYDAVRAPAAVPPPSMLRLLVERLRNTPGVS